MEVDTPYPMEVDTPYPMEVDTPYQCNDFLSQGGLSFLRLRRSPLSESYQWNKNSLIPGSPAGSTKLTKLKEKIGLSGELDGTPTLPDGRDTTKTVETNLVILRRPWFHAILDLTSVLTPSLLLGLHLAEGGEMSGITTAMATCPLDLIRTRLAAQCSKKHYVEIGGHAQSVKLGFVDYKWQLV
ncbi:reverse transcriptase domain-containing protein [Tanacetum coccineum]